MREDINQKKIQVLKNITYRLNTMRAWDLMIFTKEKYKTFNDKEKLESVFDNSLVLDPAFEISIIFVRQLLEFLRINYNYKKNDLEDFIATKKKTPKEDDIDITLLYPTMTSFPIDNSLTRNNIEHLKCLIKVANKAAAHLTSIETSKAEFESLKIARQIIYELILHYVPDLDIDLIWWTKKDEQRNAIIK